ncbi:MAG: PAS domain-containing protein [Myxococcales bacterium]|nr:PAS domain-containing protein [Myxococcales bacterium]
MKDSPDIHRTLARQLRRLGIRDLERPPPPEAWRDLLAVISRTYASAEEDRYLLERSLDISSREMEELNENLRLSSETRVAAERDRLNSIVEALDDGLFVLDTDGVVQRLNGAAQRLLGADAEALIGTKVFDRFIFRGEGAPESADPASSLAAILRLRQSMRFDSSVLLREGRPPRELACTLSPLIAGDSCVGAVFVLHDMTAVRRSEMELRQLADALRTARDKALDANRAKSSFLANISHELRTPLNAIIGYSELISEEIEEFHDDSLDEAIGEDNRRIHQAADHLLHLINDVLDVSKIEAGKMQVEVIAFDVPELLAAVAAVIEPLMNQGGNQFFVRCAPEIREMRSDRTKLKQALFNLLSNAAKFTHEGVVRLDVTLETEDGERLIIFAVSDTGIGIPPEKLRDLFNAFMQVDASTSRKYGGTGLGLTITREFCRMLGGEVEVDSVLGEGSTFRIRLPLRPRAAT